MTRSGLIFGLYGALALTAILISAGRGNLDIYRLTEVSTPLNLILSPLVGLGIAFIVIYLSRYSNRRYRWARILHLEFKNILGPLSGREILLLALASSIGEELLFRGALQPWIGLWPQAIIFALLHIGPGTRFLPWTISAFVLGLGFGYVFSLLGDLGAPIVAHFTINFVNLHYIVKVDFPEESQLQLQVTDEEDG